jgi:hypothetical protein
MLDTAELERRYGDYAIDGEIMAGLLLMYLAGAWGKRPQDLADFIGIVSLGRNSLGVEKERMCAAKPVTYRWGFGRGTGDSFCVQFTRENNGFSMRQQGNAVIRGVNPFSKACLTTRWDTDMERESTILFFVLKQRATSFQLRGITVRTIFLFHSFINHREFSIDKSPLLNLWSGCSSKLYNS